jgi:tRNA (mo5U34)-methyltransferase
MAGKSVREIEHGMSLMNDAETARTLVATVAHWHHKFEIAPGVVTPGSYDPGPLLEAIRLPADLTGKRVLDVGPSDGFFSLRARQRGAQVVSTDYRPKDGHGFAAMEQLSRLSFDYRQVNLYDLRAADLGQFDHVLFLGVLYHLPDMMLALVTLRKLCTGTLYLETHCEEFCPEAAAARYYKWTSLGGDFTNFWAPNRLCVLDMLYDAGFDPIEDVAMGSRLVVRSAISERSERLMKVNAAYGLFRNR